MIPVVDITYMKATATQYKIVSLKSVAKKEQNLTLPRLGNENFIYTIIHDNRLPYVAF